MPRSAPLLRLSLCLCVAAVAMSSALRPAARVRRRDQCPINNVCFAIDQSGSVEAHYGTEVEFVIGIAAALDNRRRDVRYSAVGFSDVATVIEKGTQRLPLFIASLVGMVPPFGRTNVYEGLSACFALVGDRKGKNVIIVLSDGARTVGNPTSELAGAINRNGSAAIMAVGIGADVDHSQLTPIVATASFYFPSTFKELPQKVPELVDILCG